MGDLWSLDRRWTICPHRLCPTLGLNRRTSSEGDLYARGHALLFVVPAPGGATASAQALRRGSDLARTCGCRHSAKARRSEVWRLKFRPETNPPI